jgi:hypothetical protein
MSRYDIDPMDPLSDGGVLGGVNPEAAFRMLRWNLWTDGHDLEDKPTEEEHQ